MNFEDLQASWAQYKVVKGLELISEEEILHSIEPLSEPYSLYFSTTLTKGLGFLSLFLLFCQSC